MNIREMTPGDIAAALALNNDNLPALNELDLADITELVDRCEVALVAEIDGAFAGFCIVFREGAAYASLNYAWFSERHEHFSYLDRIAVHPDARRFGVGRGFYAALVERLTGEFDVLCCEVNVRPRNDASLDFHQAIGFREVGQQDTDGGKKRVSLLELALT